MKQKKFRDGQYVLIISECADKGKVVRVIQTFPGVDYGPDAYDYVMVDLKASHPTGFHPHELVAVTSIPDLDELRKDE